MKRIFIIIIITALISNFILLPGFVTEDTNSKQPVVAVEHISQNDSSEFYEITTSMTRGSSSPITEFEWPMFRGNASHRGVSPSEGPPTKNVLWFNNSGGGQCYSSVSIGDGKVFFGKTNGRVYAFDRITGAPLWNTGSSIPGQSYGVCSTPAYNDGHIVIINNLYNTVYRINASDGSINWSRDYGNGQYGGSSPVIYDGKVFVGTSQSSGSDFGKLVVTYENNGTEVWNYTTGSGAYGVQSSPAIWNDMVYVGGSDGYIYCFNITQSGTPTYIWRYNSGQGIYSSPMIANDTLFIGNGLYWSTPGNRRLFAMDPDPDDNHDGAIDSSDTDEGLPDTMGSEYDIKWIFNVTYSCIATAVWYENTVFVSEENGSLYAIKEDPDGSGYIEPDEIIWEVDLTTGSDYLWSSPAVSDGRLYVGSESDIFYCINTTTGSIIWSEGLANDVECSPAIAGSRVYVTNIDGRLYCFSKSSDETPPAITSHSPASSAVDVSVDAGITVIFSESIEQNTITGSTFRVRNSTGALVSGSTNYNDAQFNLTLTPSNPLDYNETYTVTVSAYIRDTVGNSLDGDDDGIMEIPPEDDFVWSFTTKKLYPPKLKNIPQQNPNEDIVSILDLSQYIVDVDTPLNDLLILENSSYVTLNGYNLSFLYPNGILYDLVNLSIEDPFDSVYQNIEVVVAPVNDPPSIIPIPNQYLKEEVDYVLNVSSYISDIDNDHSELTVSTNSSYGNVSGSEITFNYPQGITFEFIEISVTDGEFINSTNLVIYIDNINDPPGLSEPKVSPMIGTIDTKFVYSVIYTDIENEPPSFVRVFIDGNPLIMTASDKHDKTYTDGRAYQYIRKQLSSGSHTYKFDCSDGNTDGLDETLEFSGPEVLKTDKCAVKGNVTDSSTGEPIPAAFVFMVNLTDVSKLSKVVCDEDGSYIKINVQHGIYEIYAKATDYETSSKQIITLSESDIQVIDFQLKAVSVPEEDTEVTNTDITANRTTAETDGEISFSGSASDADGDELTYIWNFGDGSDEFGKDVQHSYSKTGKYTVTLTVTDTDGDVALALIEITITDPGDVITDTPVTNVEIQADRTSVFIGETISFTGSATDLDGDLLTFEWDFGDGSTGAKGKSAAHTFSSEGLFTVTLNVTDTDGTTGSASVKVHIQKEPSKSDEDEKMSGTTIGLIAAVVIIAIVVIAFFLFTKKRKTEKEKIEVVAEPPVFPQQMMPPTQPVPGYPVPPGHQGYPKMPPGRPPMQYPAMQAVEPEAAGLPAGEPQLPEGAEHLMAPSEEQELPPPELEGAAEGEPITVVDRRDAKVMEVSTETFDDTDYVHDEPSKTFELPDADSDTPSNDEQKIFKMPGEEEESQAIETEQEQTEEKGTAEEKEVKKEKNDELFNI